VVRNALVILLVGILAANAAFAICWLAGLLHPHDLGPLAVGFQIAGISIGMMTALVYVGLAAIRKLSWSRLRPARIGLRFSLGAMLAGLTIVCFVLGVYADRVGKQRRAVEMIQRYGGEVGYSHQRVQGSYHGQLEPAAPRWLRELVGDDYFVTVDGVWIRESGSPAGMPAPSQMTDEEFALLADLPRIVDLHLNAVHIDDDDLALIGRLNHLEVLEINSSQLSDTGLERLANLTGLRQLSILSGPEPQHRKNPPGITDRGLSHLKRLTKLESLILDNSNVTDEGMSQLADLKDIETVGAYFAPGTDLNLAWISQWPKLQFLALGRGRLTSNGCEELASCKALDSFLVIDATLPATGLRQLAALPKLSLLDVENTPIPDDGLQNLSQVEYLTLMGPTVTDSTLQQLKHLTKLTFLSLNDTQITDAGLAHLNALPALSFLFLDNTRVTDAGLSHLQNLPLRRVRLECTQVTEPAAERLRQATGADVTIGPVP